MTVLEIRDYDNIYCISVLHSILHHILTKKPKVCHDATTFISVCVYILTLTWVI